MKQYFVYILGNERPTLYIGITNNLIRRVYEHKSQKIDGFTKKYKLTKLLYFEAYSNVEDAITREKRLKHWNREWKIHLIRNVNPALNDISSSIVE